MRSQVTVVMPTANRSSAILTSLASVQAQQEVTIDEGVTRTRAQLVYEISRAELAQLSIEVPAEGSEAITISP